MKIVIVEVGKLFTIDINVSRSYFISIHNKNSIAMI